MGRGQFLQGRITNISVANRVITLNDPARSSSMRTDTRESSETDTDRSRSDDRIGSDRTGLGGLGAAGTLENRGRGSAGTATTIPESFRIAEGARVFVNGRSSSLAALRNGMFARIHTVSGDLSGTTDRQPARDRVIPAGPVYRTGALDWANSGTGAGGSSSPGGIGISDRNLPGPVFANQPQNTGVLQGGYQDPASPGLRAVPRTARNRGTAAADLPANRGPDSMPSRGFGSGRASTVMSPLVVDVIEATPMVPGADAPGSDTGTRTGSGR